MTSSAGRSRVRITRDGGRVYLRDRPALFWALGVFLLAGGALAIAMPLGLAVDADRLRLWERIASIGIGAGVCAGALWWLERSPGTEVQLDLTHRSLRLVRRGIFGRVVRQIPFDQLEGALVSTETTATAAGCTVPRSGCGAVKSYRCPCCGATTRRV
jgi:hypothetical protein